MQLVAKHGQLETLDPLERTAYSLPDTYGSSLYLRQTTFRSSIAYKKQPCDPAVPYMLMRSAFPQGAWWKLLAPFKAMDYSGRVVKKHELWSHHFLLEEHLCSKLGAESKAALALTSSPHRECVVAHVPCIHVKGSTAEVVEALRTGRYPRLRKLTYTAQTEQDVSMELPPLLEALSGEARWTSIVQQLGVFSIVECSCV